MAKSKLKTAGAPAGAPAAPAPAAIDDVIPVRDFAPAAEVGDTGPRESPPAADPRDEELRLLRAENARLKAAREGSEFAGRKCRVKLKDGPTAVVACEPGEHPFDAFKRVTGVLGSQHSPQIEEADPVERCGICGPDGKVPEPRK